MNKQYAVVMQLMKETHELNKKHIKELFNGGMDQLGIANNITRCIASIDGMNKAVDAMWLSLSIKNQDARRKDWMQVSQTSYRILKDYHLMISHCVTDDLENYYDWDNM